MLRLPRIRSLKPDPAATPSYVLGSSGSILDLSLGQRQFLSGHPHVFGMNKFFLYWEKAGIAPSHFFLADYHFPTYLVFQRTLEKLGDLPRRPTLCLDRGYRPFLTSRVPQADREAAQEQIVKWSAEHPKIAFRTFDLEDDDVVYFFRKHDFSKPRWWNWADSLDQPMYFWRSSLTVLINLITVLRPCAPIVLVGVDLNRTDYFFDEEFHRDSEFHDHTYGRHPDLHATAAPLGRAPGIHERWEFITRMCKKRGVTVFNANPESLLVQMVEVDHLPIPELDASGRV